MQAEPLRFLATGPANRHVKQDDPILLADHPIWLAKDEIVTVPAEEYHELLRRKRSAGFFIPFK